MYIMFIFFILKCCIGPNVINGMICNYCALIIYIYRHIHFTKLTVYRNVT